MDIQILTEFFKWCSILGIALLMLSAGIYLWAKDSVYKIHSQWIDISRENFNLVFYCFLGLFKVVVWVFAIIPYLALVIVG